MDRWAKTLGWLADGWERGIRVSRLVVQLFGLVRKISSPCVRCFSGGKRLGRREREWSKAHSMIQRVCVLFDLRLQPAMGRN